MKKVIAATARYLAKSVAAVLAISTTGYLDPFYRSLLRASPPVLAALSDHGEALWKSPTPEMFATIDSGNWRQLCLIGGYEHPCLPDLQVSWRSWKPGLFMRLINSVQEFETAVFWITRDGSADMAYLPNFGSADTPHLRACFDRDNDTSSKGIAWKRRCATTSLAGGLR